MKKLFICFTFFYFNLLLIKAQEFSGAINFKYATVYDTTLNVYYVKNQVVRLDQFARKKNIVEGSFIFNLKSNEVQCLNPKRKLWAPQKNTSPQIIKGECIVTKGHKTKIIADLKCTEYIVKNTVEDLVISYWIAHTNFNFFSSLINLWNRKDKQSVYFRTIKGLEIGCMPMLSEEKQISSGKSISKLEVTKISLIIPKEVSLKIPSDFSKFE